MTILGVALAAVGLLAALPLYLLGDSLARIVERESVDASE